MSTQEPSTDEIRSRLQNVIDPCSEANGTNMDVVEMGLLKDIEVDEGRVTVDIRLTSPHCMMIPFFVQRIDEEVGELPAVESVEVTHDTGMEWRPAMITESGQRKRKRSQDHLRARMERAMEQAKADAGE